jgi:hypothetical protein
VATKTRSEDAFERAGMSGSHCRTISEMTFLKSHLAGHVINALYGAGKILYAVGAWITRPLDFAVAHNKISWSV